MKQVIRQLLCAIRRKALGSLRSGWQKLRKQPDTSVYEEIGVGALIGWSTCVVLSWDFSPLVAAVIALCGLCFGAVIGLLLWIDSANLPEEHISPPMERERRPSKSRSRDDRREPPER